MPSELVVLNGRNSRAHHQLVTLAVGGRATLLQVHKNLRIKSQTLSSTRSKQQRRRLQHTLRRRLLKATAWTHRWREPVIAIGTCK